MVDDVTAAMIERLRAGGMAKDQIGKLLGVSRDVIDKYYGEEFEAGNASLISKIALNMAVIAQDPDHKQAVSAGKFMLSRMLPEVFSERQQIQILGKDGRPIDPKSSTTLDPYQLTEEQRAALREAVTDVLREAVDDANGYRQSQVPEAEYAMIEDATDVVEYEESGDE
jgi:hypothetical protein